MSSTLHEAVQVFPMLGRPLHNPSSLIGYYHEDPLFDALAAKDFVYKKR